MTIEEQQITSADGEYTRTVWLASPIADEPHSLGVFLDGEFYLKRMASLSVIESLIASATVPPLTSVFVSHVDGVNRHADMTCNPRYARFIAEDVVNWARQRHPQIACGGHLLAGVSLSALAAAHAATLYPSVFSTCLCQSGSFWWLADHEIELPATRAKFWLSVGDQETATDVSHPPTPLLQRVSQIDGVADAANRLRAAGGEVRHCVFSGGHAFEPWTEELPKALTWLLCE